MKVLEIRGATGTSKILIGERIQNLPFYIPGARTIFVTDQTVRRLFPGVFSGYVTIDIPAGERRKLNFGHTQGHRGARRRGSRFRGTGGVYP